MNHRINSLILSACAAVLAVSTGAFAGITTYTTRALFNAGATGALTTEGFESMPVADLTLPAAINPSGLVVSEPNGAVTVYIDTQSVNGFANTTPAGSKYLAYGRNPAAGGFQNGNYSAQFALPVTANAFAFDYTGFQPSTFGSGGFTVTLLKNNATVDSAFVPDATDFGTDFRGFISTANFDTVRLSITTAVTTADYTAFDEVSWNTVPEPGTLGLAAMIVGGAAFPRRRRILISGK